MLKLSVAVLGAAISIQAVHAHAASSRYVGINLSGGEDGTPSGTSDNTYGYDYIYPPASEIDYFHSIGVNFLRIPFVWERLQPTQMGALSAAQLGYIETAVAEAAKDGMGVILDDHDYGKAFGGDIGTAAAPTAAFANYWTQLATAFKGYDNIVFGIENEPHDQTATAWAAIDQAVITAIRSTGATQEILASGSDWDGARQWVSSGDAAAALTITDSINKTVFEVHQYLDLGGSGTTCTIATQGAADLAAATAWAKAAGKKLWLGEIGVCSDSTSLAALTATLTYLNANTNVWQGVTYWAGGPWMGRYQYTADPSSSGVRSPQTAALMAAH